MSEQDKGAGWQDRAPVFTDPSQPDQVTLRTLGYIVESLSEVALKLSAGLDALKGAMAGLARDLDTLHFDLMGAHEALDEVSWVSDPYDYQLWEHPQTGVRYAVRLSAGQVIGSAVYDLGTATFEDLQGRLYADASLAAWANGHRGEFTVLPLISQAEREREYSDLQARLREAPGGE